MAASKIQTYKQNIVNMALREIINSSGERRCRLAFTSERDKVKNTLSSSYSFTLNNKKNILEFEEIKKSGIELTHDFKLYSKGTLFAISDKNLRKTLEELFKTENCNSIFAGVTYDDDGNISLYYSPDIDFESLDKIYEYKNSLIDKTISTTPHDISQKDSQGILSNIQKQMFFSMVHSVVSRVTKEEFDYTEGIEYHNKTMKILFSNSLSDDETIQDIAENVLSISTGGHLFKDIISDDFPMEKLKKLYLSSSLVASGHFGEAIKRASNNSVPIINMNILNIDELSMELQENFSYAKEFYIPSFSERTETFNDDIRVIPPSILESFDEHSESIYNGAIVSAIDGFYHFGSGSKKQSSSSITLTHISSIDEATKTISKKIFHSTSVYHIQGKTEKETEEIFKELSILLIEDDRTFIPCYLSNGNISITVAPVDTSKFLNDNAVLSLHDAKSLLQNSKRDIYSVMLESASSLKKANNVVKNFISDISKSMSYETNEKDLKSFVNTFSNKMNSFLSVVPREHTITTYASNIKNTDMNFFSSLNNIGLKSKIFPDIINMKNPDMSIEDISNSLFHVMAWLKIPEYHDIIKEQLKRNGFPVPSVFPASFSLSDKKKNKLLPANKKSIVSISSHTGMMKFQLYPTLIQLNDKKDIDEFFNFSSRAVGSLLPSDSKQDISDIYKTLSSSYSSRLAECKYIVMKIEPVINKGGLVKMVEHFVGVDEKMREKIIFDIPVMEFFKELEKDGFIKAENTLKNASFSEKNIDAIFTKIVDYVKSSKEKNKDIFSTVDRIFGSHIQAFGEKENYSFDIKKISYINTILKNNNGKFLSDELLTKKPISFTKELDKMFPDEMSENQIIFKNSIVNFWDKNLKGKEYFLLDEKKRTAIENVFFKKFGESQETKKVMGILNELSAEYNFKAEADIKIISSDAFLSYVHNKSIHGLDSEGKNEVINIFLYKILGLKPHQVLEAKGFIALYLKGDVNLELLFWEMRTGKTRTMEVMLFLLSLLQELPSVFFIQNKNNSDIIGQMFELYPFFVSDSSTVLGEKTDFKVDSTDLPIALSEFIFPNIVSTLKRDGILKNPTTENKSPADILASTYTKDFQKIYDIVKTSTSSSVEKMISENNIDHPEYEFFQKAIDLSEHKMLKDIITSVYFYVIHLYASGFLVEKDKKETVEVLEKKVFEFIKKYHNSKNVSQISENDMARIIFAGKNYFDSVTADSNSIQTIKTQNTRLDSFTTELDILYSNPHNVNENIGVEANRDLCRYSLQIPSDLKDIVDTGKGVLLVHENSKRMKDFSKEASKKVSQDISTAINSFCDNPDSNKTHQLIKEYASLIKKVSSVAVSRILTDTDTNQSFFNSGAVESSSLKYNGDAVPLSYINTEFIFVEKIFNAIPQTLVSSGACESIADAKEISDEFFENVNLPKILAKSITTAGLNFLMDSIYFKENQKTNTFSSFILSCYPMKGNAPVYNIDFEINFDKSNPPELMSLPTKKRDENVFTQNILRISSVSPSKSNLSYFQNNECYPTKLRITQNSSKVVLNVLEAVSSSGESVGLNIKDTKKLSSGIIWGLEDSKKLAVVTTDESHKGTKGKQGEALRAFHDKIRENYPDAAIILATGTPDPISAYESVSNKMPSKVSENIKRYSNVYQIKSFLIIAILESLKSNKSTSEILSSNISDAALKINSVSSISDVSWEASKRILSELLKDKSFESQLESINMSNSKQKRGSPISELSIVIQGVIKNIKSNPDENIEIPLAFENAAKDPKNKICKITPEKTNLCLSSYIFDIFDNGNVSLKRPHGIGYNVKDKDVLKLYKEDKLPSLDLNTKEKESLLQLAYLEKRKMFTAVLGHTVFSFYQELFSAIENSVKENCETLFGLELYEYNELCNRSQKSVEDGLFDDFTSFLKKGEKPLFKTAQREEIYDLITESIIKLSEPTNLLHLVDSPTKKENTTVSLPLFDCSLSSSSRKAFFSHISSLASKDIFIENADTLKKENVKFLVSLNDNGVLYKDIPEKKEFTLKSQINFNYRIDKSLPLLKFGINLNSADDRSIIDSLAHHEKFVETLTEELDDNLNIREMTSRVTMTKASLLYSLMAGAKRKNIANPLNIVVAVSDSSLKAFMNNIIENYSTFLSDNNIKIVETDSKAFNVDCQSILGKQEQIMVIGNYVALAEGVAMDFIHSGHYIGSLDIVSSAIQSFARQVGNRQQISNFTLAQNGYLSSLDGQLLSSYGQFLDFSGTISITDEVGDYKISSLNPERIKRIVPFAGNTNARMNDHLIAYEIVMTGKLEDSVVISLDNEKKYLSNIINAEIVTDEIEEDIKQSILVSEDEEKTSTPSI